MEENITIPISFLTAEEILEIRKKEEARINLAKIKIKMIEDKIASYQKNIDNLDHFFFKYYTSCNKCGGIGKVSNDNENPATICEKCKGVKYIRTYEV